MFHAIGYVFFAMPFVVAVGLGIALPLLGLLLYTRFRAGAIFVVAVFLTDALFIGNTRLNLGINLYLNDLAFVLLGAVALARWLLAREMPRRHGAWLLFVLLFAIGLGIGLASNGTRAGVQARDYFYAIVAASYFMSFRIDAHRVQQFIDVLAASSAVLLLLCLYRWTVYYWPLPELLPRGGVWSPDGPTRVIASHEALVLAQLLLLGLLFPKPGGGMQGLRIAAPLLLGAVVALQHRSVWIATLIGVVTALTVVRSHSASRLAQVAALVAVVGLTAVPLIVSERLAKVSREVGQSATTALSGQGSVHSRLEDWQQTLRDWSRSGPREWALGYGFGRDSTRTLMNEVGERRVIRFGAHNHYVAMLTNTGVLGLAAFAVLILWLLAGLYGLCRRGEGGVAAPALFTLIVMQLAYYVPYGTDFMQHALLGLAVAYVATQQREHGTQRSVPAAAGATAGSHALQRRFWR